MKKIKYLLFIIPLFLIFIGNTKAYTFYEDSSITIDEEFISNKILEEWSNFDYSTYNHVYCFETRNRYDYIQGLTCGFFDNSVIFPTCSGASSCPNGKTFSPSSSYYSIVISSIRNDTRTFSYDFNSSNINIYTYGEVYPSYFKGLSNFLIDYTSSNGQFVENILNFDDYFSSNEPEPEFPTIENKIYLPDELEEGNCPVILNKDTIRVYEEEPQSNVSVNYTDYFINSHYIKQNGAEILSDTITCLPLTDFTTSYVYRFDFDKILIIFIILVSLFSYIIMKIIHAFFIGFKRR